MVVEAFSVHCLIKYRDREIQSLIMRVMQYVVGRKWSAENVDFGVVLDGENEFIRAYDIAT